MIEIKNLYKSFDNIPVLKDINLTLHEGQNNLIIGQSGSGKTVLMKCLVGLHLADSGQILYDGRNFANMSENERKKIRKEIGMLFQGSALFDSMSVEENVRFPLDIFTNMKKDEKLERTNFCLKRVDIINKNNLFPSEISGGMKKRVAIARAISLQPKYLFCDEPNSGLDPKTSILIDQLISEITHEYNITTIINTHDMNSVLEIGDHISYIHHGELWWNGTKDEILITNNNELNEFVYASELTRKIKQK